MKHICVLFPALLFSARLTAQQPQFVMPIWFEDALGNRDTVWVGGDENASSSDINAQFGEEALTAPFDSIFEVRAVHGDDQLWRTSKIIIEHDGAPSQCYLPAHTRIMVHALRLPIRVSWDTFTLKQNYPCNINTVLCPNWDLHALQHWYAANYIECMMVQSSFYDSMAYTAGNIMEHEFPVQGLGVIPLKGYFFSGFWDYPHCYTTLDAGDVPEARRWTIYPNPFDHTFSVEGAWGPGAEYLIFDNLLRTMAQGRLTTDGLSDTLGAGLPPGMYYLKISERNKNDAFFKIIKTGAGD